LSQLINQSFEVNFQEYVNGYRVRALQAAMQDEKNQDVTILGPGAGRRIQQQEFLKPRIQEPHRHDARRNFAAPTKAAKAPIDHLRPVWRQSDGPNHHLGRKTALR
jgi:hypothetical protein